MSEKASGSPENLLIFDLADLEADSQFLGIDGKELVFKDRMYDIVKIEKDQKGVRYHVIEDVREQQLMDSFQNESKSKDYKSIFEQIIKIALQGEPGIHVIPASIEITYPELSLPFPNPGSETPAPPPWIS